MEKLSNNHWLLRHNEQQILHSYLIKCHATAYSLRSRPSLIKFIAYCNWYNLHYLYAIRQNENKNEWPTHLTLLSHHFRWYSIDLCKYPNTWKTTNLDNEKKFRYNNNLCRFWCCYYYSCCCIHVNMILFPFKASTMLTIGIKIEG